MDGFCSCLISFDNLFQSAIAFVSKALFGILEVFGTTRALVPDLRIDIPWRWVTGTNLSKTKGIFRLVALKVSERMNSAVK